MAAIVPELGVYLKYHQKDITSLLAPYVISVSATDSLDAKDSLKITLDDSSGKWQDAWYPVKTDELTLEIGYKGKDKLKLGKFRISEIELSGTPDQVIITADSPDITSDQKTKKTRTFENKTLKEIVSEIASDNNLTVSENIENISFKRRTQNNISDEAFLKQLADEYGYYMAVKFNELIFTKKNQVKKESGIAISKNGCTTFKFIDKTNLVYKSCSVSYWSPKDKRCLTYTEKAQGLKTGDELIIKERVENAEQAKARAKAALEAKNERQVTGSLTLPGDIRFVAGVQLDLSGFGVLSGVYTITEAVHNFSASGWNCSLSIRRNELKKDDPKEEKKPSASGVASVEIKGDAFAWSEIIDDDGNVFKCLNGTAARFNALKKLVHDTWPDQVFWVSCTTEGKHLSPEHPEGRAIDCGVVGIGKTESYKLETLAQSVGFKTFNEYVNDSAYKTGAHMHLYW